MNAKQPESQEIKMAPPSLIQAGLIAISFLVIPILTGSGHLDTLVTLSLCFLAFAIPILGICSYHSRIPPVTRRERGILNKRYNYPTLIGTLSAIIGITFAFFHMALLVGVIFSISGACAFVLWFMSLPLYRGKEFIN